MAVMATVTVRPPARRVATVPPARSIWHSSQPPKMSPCGLVSAGMAMVRIAGSDVGGISGTDDAAACSAIIAPRRFVRGFSLQQAPYRMDRSLAKADVVGNGATGAGRPPASQKAGINRKYREKMPCRQ